jgi:hypothetical protein
MEASTGALFLIGGALLGLARYAGPRIAKRSKNENDAKPTDRTSGPAPRNTTPPRISDRPR